jgi:hypothetical protein
MCQFLQTVAPNTTASLNKKCNRLAVFLTCLNTEKILGILKAFFCQTPGFIKELAFF